MLEDLACVETDNRLPEDLSRWPVQLNPVRIDGQDKSDWFSVRQLPGKACRPSLYGMRLHLDEGDCMVLPVNDGGIKPVISRSRHGPPSFLQVSSLFPTTKVVV